MLNFCFLFKYNRKILLVTKTAVNIEQIIPTLNVVANPLIGPDPINERTKAVNNVVTFASNIVKNALHNSFTGCRINNSSVSGKLRAQTNLSLKKIKDFNLNERNKKPSGESYRQNFEFRRQVVGQPEIQTLPDMLDAEDAHEFGIPSDLTLMPPISSHSGAVLGICCLGRLISKAKSVLTGKLGNYKFGNASGLDIGIMDFIDINQVELLDGVAQHSNWLNLISWLRSRISKSQQEITEWNQDRRLRGPWNSEVQQIFDQRCQTVNRMDLTTFLDLLDCEDAADFSHNR